MKLSTIALTALLSGCNCHHEKAAEIVCNDAFPDREGAKANIHIQKYTTPTYNQEPSLVLKLECEK